MDEILIENLEVRCIIGTLPRERTRKQAIRIDLAVACDAGKAARRDRLGDALDYRRIAQDVRDFAGSSRFFLIETLADRIAGLVIKRFRVSQATVTLRKPAALRPLAACVGVTLTRRK